MQLPGTVRKTPPRILRFFIMPPKMPAYQRLVEEAAELASERGGGHAQMAGEFIDRLFVLFGCEILKVVAGRVSTEVAASLSFDTESTIAKGRKLISLYETKGVSPPLPGASRGSATPRRCCTAT